MDARPVLRLESTLLLLSLPNPKTECRCRFCIYQRGTPRRVPDDAHVDRGRVPDGPGDRGPCHLRKALRCRTPRRRERHLDHDGPVLLTHVIDEAQGYHVEGEL